MGSLSGIASAKRSLTLAVNMNRFEAASDEENIPSILVHSMVSDDLGKLLTVNVSNSYLYQEFSNILRAEAILKQFIHLSHGFHSRNSVHTSQDDGEEKLLPNPKRHEVDEDVLSIHCSDDDVTFFEKIENNQRKRRQDIFDV